VTGQTINGTKRPGVPMLGPLTPIHLGGIPSATDQTPAAPTEEPTVAAEPAYDPIAHAEADRIRDLAKAQAEALRIEAEGKAEAERIRAEADSKAKDIAAERSRMRLEKEQADHALRLAEATQKREAIERERLEATRVAEAAKEEQDAAAEEIAKADAKWRSYAIWFARVCAVVALPVQMNAFWNPRAPWLLAAPLMLEGGSWVVQRGAASAVANRRPLWHYRTIAWLLAMIAAGINLWHGINAFDPATAIATAFASLAGPGVWDLHEHGRIRRRDGVLTRRETKAKEAAEKRAAAERAAREKAAKEEKAAAEKAAQEAVDKLAKDREQLYPKVWEHAKKLAAALGETTVTEAVWRRAHKDVEGTDPGDSAEAQNLRNAAARRLLDARSDAPEKSVWKAQEVTTNAQRAIQVKGPRGGSSYKPIPPRRTKGDTAPFHPVAKALAAEAKRQSNTAREDS
jgi:chemotaxis protein histidine kinase CheA